MTREMTLRALGVLGVVGLALTGCADGGADDKDDTDTDTMDSDTDTVVTEQAKIRVVHASPTAPAVSLWSGGAKLGDDLAYGEATGFLSLDPGTYTIDICVAGASDCASPVYSVEDVALSAGDVITTVAAGDLGSTDAASAFRVLAFAHGFTAPAAGDAVVRIVHASADAPSVGIDVGDDDNASPEVGSLARWAETGAAGVALPGDMSLAVALTPAGGGDKVTSFTTPALGDGGEWFVIATGFLGDKSYSDTGFGLLAVNGDSSVVAFIGQDPRVYALHGAYDAPAVDVFVGDAEVFGNVAFGGFGGIQVQPGTYTFDLFGADTSTTMRPAGDPAFAVPNVVLEAGEEYLVLATGSFLSTNPSDNFRVLAIPADFDQTVEDAQVQVFHGSADTPAVDVSTSSGFVLSTPPVFSDISFGEASTEVAELPAGTYTLGVGPTGTTSALLQFTVPIAGDEQAWAIAAGSFYNVGGNGIRLLVVDTAPTPWTLTPVSGVGAPIIVEQ